MIQMVTPADSSDDSLHALQQKQPADFVDIK